MLQISHLAARALGKHHLAVHVRGGHRLLVHAVHVLGGNPAVRARPRKSTVAAAWAAKKGQDAVWT